MGHDINILHLFAFCRFHCC